MGVVFARFAEDDSVLGLAKNSERNLESTPDELTEDAEVATEGEAAE
jgi:DNA gyrase subunit A